MSNLVQHAYETSHARLALGHERLTSRFATLVRDRTNTDVYDANFAALVRAASPQEVDDLLAELDRAFADCDHRYVCWDPGMPQPFEARLLIDGWQRHNELVTLVLEGELGARGPAVAVRPVVSDSDWATVEALQWLEHSEEVTLGFHPAWDRSITEALVRTKRSKAPAVQYQLACVDGVDCAYFSAWPGENGVGQVEDLFTRAEFRGRGIGTALIASCVDDARARGAGPVIVNPRVDDTPKQMYAALGFRPLCVQRGYLKSLDAA